MSKSLRKYTQSSRPLGPASMRVVEYFFANPNKTQKEIAKDMGISPSRVSNIMNNPRVIQAYPVLARQRIQQMVPKAVKAFGELMDQKENLEVRRKVVVSALESSKVLETPKIEINNTISVAPTEELVRIVEQSNNIRLNAIDAEVVEDEKPLLG